MTDSFHRSLDRALGVRNPDTTRQHWPLANCQAVPTDDCMRDMGYASSQELPGMWDASDFLGGVEEVRGADWEPGTPFGHAADLRDFADAVNNFRRRVVLEHAASLWDFADAVNNFKPSVIWQIPERPTIEVREATLEELEVIFEISLIPLCHRRIPCEGQE